MGKPAGTGKPILVISASPAPFPPRRSRQVPSPSALPAPNKYTHFFTVVLASHKLSAAFIVIAGDLLQGPKINVGTPTLVELKKNFNSTLPLFSANLGEIRDGGELAEQLRKQGKTVLPHLFLV